MLSLLILQSAEGTGRCGERKLPDAALIAHGYKARPGAWPWHGGLFSRDEYGSTSYRCGVTILTKQFVLSVAFTTQDSEKMFFVRVGISNLLLPEEHMRQFDVNTVIRHEDFDENTFENNIALFKLSGEITYTNYIQPVCLWQGDTKLSKIDSKLGFVVGWRFKKGKLLKHLNEKTMPIVSSRKCIESDTSFYLKHYFELKTFCAGRPNRTYVGIGESGGGLFMRMGAYWIQRGIVSVAEMDPDTLDVSADGYTLFTDVAYYLNWIKTKVPDLPYFGVDPEKIIETEPETQANQLDLTNCGKNTYSSETPEEAKEFVNKYPWLAFIAGYNSNRTISRSWCHGVLIHPSFLITTARCVSQKENIKFSAWINELPLDNEKDSMENDDERVIHFSRIPVRDTFAHPDFDTPKYANDIALVKLKRPTTANPICPPSLDPLNLYDATKFHFIGSDMYKKTQNFRMDAQLVDLIACQSKFIEHGFNVTLTRGQVCSTLVDKNDNINESSFGLLSAPMQYAKTGFFGKQFFLTAFASFGIRDLLLSEFPTVFTNVVHYSDWIREKIQQN